MKQLEKLLKKSAVSRPSKTTSRQIVVFKTQQDYHQCLDMLNANGIKPVKSVDSHRLICCHFHRSTDMEKIKQHPRVAYVQRDAKVKAHAIKPAAVKRGGARKAAKKRALVDTAKIPWNVSRVKSPELWNRTMGQGVKVAIIDTGIAKHPDLCIAGGVNTITGGSFQDDNGHGTHVAGIAAATGRQKIFGNAPQVKLFAVKVLDQNGNGFVSDIVEGIDWCLKRGIKVMNMSFGLTGSGNSKALRDAVKRAAKQGAVISASAGNEGTTFSPLIDAPARYPETIAVAATDRADRVADFSSRGNGISVAAPGVDILSTLPGGTYGRMSGTSMSAPHVTGGAALLRALSPRMRPAEIKRRFEASALQIPGGRQAVGAGLLQVAPAAVASGRRFPSKGQRLKKAKSASRPVLLIPSGRSKR
ncbi:minor extracellular protease Epr [Paenibacillus rhizosphaerae]|uniref:Minor extracellular protease Epr n=1 Tax=Paenibacillus rhizosphaerae TaxID=297318 RepID=A0A839TKN0_9BACL|nr:S8 family peptidase [Paenibacillus rhizosphaerae]MBB3126300.1 minor extracellular protease Epr [Paenibacillus rhizosphaerae]